MPRNRGRRSSRRATRAPPRCFGPISRKYDLAEHACPGRARHPGHPVRGHLRARRRSRSPAQRRSGRRQRGRARCRHQRCQSCPRCSTPRNPLGRRRPAAPRCRARASVVDAAISSVVTAEQLESLGKDVWAAMAITEPGFGLGLGGRHHHRGARRRRVRDQRREDLRHRRFARHPHRGVGDARTSRLGRAAIKSFIVPRDHPRVHRSSASSTSWASRRPTPP